MYVYIYIYFLPDIGNEAEADLYLLFDDRCMRVWRIHIPVYIGNRYMFDFCPPVLPESFSQETFF